MLFYKCNLSLSLQTDINNAYGMRTVRDLHQRLTATVHPDVQHLIHCLHVVPEHTKLLGVSGK